MAWDPEALPDLSGGTIAVTSANAGIGYFIAEQLTGAGAEVVMLRRDAGRVELAIAVGRR
jgi:NAD(P)-dependent dehydrogenase (short-subunit alcohol dehydrogenase family)